VGEHTNEILSGILKLNDEEIRELKSKGIVSDMI
jgi:crotonobetainyl-CoA:carnitine CoA-transferase CaiB-like acyl-CoA transferase